MNETEIYKQVLKHWGPEEQAVVWLEELAELQQEICKLLRGAVFENPTKHNLAAVIEEIADVEVILTELKLALGIPEATVNEQKRYKLERLRKRLEEGGGTE